MGLLGNLFGNAQLIEASKKADAAQQAALANAMGTISNQFNTTSGYYQPYIGAGTSALGQYGNLLGINGGDAQQAAITAVQNSPYFQSLYNQGQQAVLQNASATGGLRGGNTEASLYNLGQQTLAQAIQQQLQGFGGLASTGLNAVGSLGNFGANEASAIGGLQTAQGQATAQDLLTQGQLKNSMWSGLGSLGLNLLGGIAGIPGLGSIFGSGGGGGTSNMFGNLFSGLKGMGTSVGGLLSGGIPTGALSMPMGTSLGTASPLTSMAGGFGDFTVPTIGG